MPLQQDFALGIHQRFITLKQDKQYGKRKEENNKMLKEILSFVRKVDSVEYRDHQDFMEFLRNVVADIWVEYTEPEQRGRLFNLINKKK